MTVARDLTLCCLLALCSWAIIGCGQKEQTELKTDENRPLDEIRAEAAKMNAEQLRAAALKYREAIVAKQEEAGNVIVKLKDLPADKIQTLQGDIDRTNKATSALTERYLIYYNKLKEKGGDLSGLDL